MLAIALLHCKKTHFLVCMVYFVFVDVVYKYHVDVITREIDIELINYEYSLDYKISMKK